MPKRKLSEFDADDPQWVGRLEAFEEAASAAIEELYEQLTHQGKTTYTQSIPSTRTSDMWKTYYSYEATMLKERGVDVIRCKLNQETEEDEDEDEDQDEDQEEDQEEDEEEDEDEDEDEDEEDCEDSVALPGYNVEEEDDVDQDGEDDEDEAGLDGDGEENEDENDDDEDGDDDL